MTPQSQPMVTTVIPAYNNGIYLGEAIDSALAQDYAPLEVFVIDDGSTDNTAEVVARYGDRVRYAYQKNQGQSVAKNHGIRNAGGEFIAFLDSDDRWRPGKLSKQMALLAPNENVGLVYTDRLKFRGDTIVHATNKIKHTPRRGRVLDHLLGDNFVVSSSVVARKSFLLEAGLFDESRRVAEDYDLWLRMARLCEFEFVDEILLEYRLSPNSIGSNVRSYFPHVIAIQQAFIDKFYNGAYPNRSAVARASANKYESLGDHCLGLGKHFEAMRAYGCALRWEPLSLSRYLSLMRAMVPNQLVPRFK